MSIHSEKTSLKNADVRYVGGLILTLAKRCARIKVQRAKGVAGVCTLMLTLEVDT